MHDTSADAPSPGLLRDKPWGPFLNEVNSKLATPVTLHCLGGFVLGAIYSIPRTTADLDYIAVIPREAGESLESIAGRESVIAKKHRVFIHFAGVISMPENYEDRLVDPSFGLDKLRLLVPDPYDLLLSKLERNSPKDREDIKFLVRKLGLQFSILQQRFNDEMKPWLPNVDRHELTLKLWKEFF